MRVYVLLLVEVTEILAVVELDPLARNVVEHVCVKLEHTYIRNVNVRATDRHTDKITV